jgi:hypothetical protein
MRQSGSVLCSELLQCQRNFMSQMGKVIRQSTLG